MKFIHGFLFLLGWIGSAVGQTPLRCGLGDNDVGVTNWRDTNSDCSWKLIEQVQKEVNASLTYLAMGAHFARDSVNRPGFSDFFLKSASEEREHAIKFLEYLSMRGNDFSAEKDLTELPLIPKNVELMTGYQALTQALATEVEVTRSIKQITKDCENSFDADKLGDYHLVDYLSGVFLEEQYTGQRDLAGKITTLGRMQGIYGNFSEFLFDKKLLYGEV